MNLQPIAKIAGYIAGAAFMQIAVNDLFYNQIGTANQIAAIAIPAFILLSSAFAAQKRTISKLDLLLVPYLFGALVIILSNAYTLQDPKSLCEFYKTCGQPDAVNPCFKMVNLCQLQLEASEWTGHSNETIKAASARLCTRILEPGKKFKALEKCTTCMRPEPKELQKIIQLQRELFRITQCNPNISKNLYYRSFKPMSRWLHRTILFLNDWSPDRSSGSSTPLK